MSKYQCDTKKKSQKLRQDMGAVRLTIMMDIFNPLQAVLAMAIFLHSKNQKIISRDASHTRAYPYRVLHKEFFDILQGCFIFFYIIHSLNHLNIIEHVFGHLLDLYCHLIMDPAWLILGDPWRKRALQGPSMVLYISQDNRQALIYSLV